MDTSTPAPPNLRKVAEQRLALQSGTEVPVIKAASTASTASTAGASDDALLHELNVHQIELEMQNVALRDAQLELEAARDRYIDLFEFAPVGYVTLDSNGYIVEINLTATRLVGIKRKRLLGRRFASLVAAGERDIWHRFFLNLRKIPERLDCELQLLREQSKPFHVKVIGSAVQGAYGSPAMRITIVDVTADKEHEALNESALRLRMAVEALAGGLYDWNRRSGELYWSSTHAEAWGAAKLSNGVSRHSWRTNINPADLQLMRRDFKAALKRRSQRFSVEYRLRRQDGSWRYVSDRGLIVRDASGRLLRLVGTLTDITERKAEEERRAHSADILEEAVAQRTAELMNALQGLRDAERFARGTIDSLSSRLCVLNEHGEIIATNRAWDEYAQGACGNALGAQQGGCPGAPFALPCWSGRVSTCTERAVRDIVTGAQDSFQMEYECALRGAARWFEMSVTRFAGEGPVRLVVRHDEITERKLAELNQNLASARVKQLGSHLETVREEQNAMIARELHDELGASLTMLKLGLASAATDAAGGKVNAARLEALVGLVDSGLQVVKRISANLRPATLDTLGLVATIKWYVEQFSRTTGIASVLRLPDWLSLSAAANIAVFRIAQEGLTNVARHSGADWVRVSMFEYRGVLILRIVDNGSGVSARSLERPDSFGVIGMHERAQHLGGSLAITNRASGGACLTLQVPLDS